MHCLAFAACALLNQIAMEPATNRDSEFHQDESTFYTRRHGVPADAVDSVAVAPDGTLWVSANGALATYAARNDRWIEATEKPSFAAETIGSTGSRLWAVRANEYAFWDGKS